MFLEKEKDHKVHNLELIAQKYEKMEDDQYHVEGC